ncbi:hypothetical protein FAVG1_12671 [Fusarium avenaceum]|nr:hypothetical protein FAVG1_12671 [Fusarium avenaceum]
MTASDIYPLASVPQQVTASWLGKVSGQNVKSAELIYSMLNATASKLLYIIEYEDDTNAEDQARYVCIKGGFNPAMLAGEGYKDLLIAAYTNKAIFFSIVAPTLGHISPQKVWWAGNQGEQGILVMEDSNNAEFTLRTPQNGWYGLLLTPYDLQLKERVFPMCECDGAAVVDYTAIELVESLPGPER